MRRFFYLFFVIFSASYASAAQSPSSAANSALKDSTKPPVYLEFVRSGKCTKDPSNFNFGSLCASKREDAVTFDAAWLRLVNNTRWSIGVTVEKAATERNATSVVIPSTEFTDDDGQKAWFGELVASNGAEMDVVYKSESETGCDFSKKAPKGQRCFRRETIPSKIPLPALSSDLFISPGQSIVFPINRAHVKEYVNLYVLYNFSWEYSGKQFSHFPNYDSQHRAYFGWFDLEKGILAESEKRRAA
jgi:hypothetical protein